MPDERGSGQNHRPADRLFSLLPLWLRFGLLIGVSLSIVAASLVGLTDPDRTLPVLVTGLIATLVATVIIGVRLRTRSGQPRK